MSDHSKPRRWTLVGRTKGEPVDDPRIEVLKPTRGPFTGHLNTVSVREDCITTEDVEAVAKLMAQMENNKDPLGDHEPLWAECNDEEKAAWRAEAAEFLARIFEGGEQS